MIRLTRRPPLALLFVLTFVLIFLLTFGSYVNAQAITTPADVTGTISTGTTFPLSITSPTQNAQLTFKGTAGQSISLDLTGVTITKSTVTIKGPGRTLASESNIGTGGRFFDALKLEETGTYTIIIDPEDVRTGSMKLTLSVFSDVTGIVAIDGPLVPAAVTKFGQNAQLTFAGTAGQKVNLNIGNVTVISGGVTIQQPGGGVDPGQSKLLLAPSGTSLDMILPETGNYTILIDPSGINTGGMTVSLTALQATTGSTGSIALNGGDVTVSAKAGQSNSLTFSGTFGQHIKLQLSGVTIQQSMVSIKQPDGTLLIDPTSVTTDGSTIESPFLPANGVYTIVIDADGNYAGDMTLSLVSDASATNSVITVNTPGENGQLTFTANGGDHVFVEFGEDTLNSSYRALIAPDGTVLDAFNQSSSNAFDVPLLPANGKYTILVDPADNDTGNLTVTLSVVSDFSSPIAVNGAPVPVATSLLQNARLTFSGTPGQRLALRFSSGTYPDPVQVLLVGPDGPTLSKTESSITSDGFMNLPILAAAGEYTIVIDAPRVAGSFTASLISISPELAKLLP